MTPTEYQNMGYRVSLQLEQAIIDRAETTAMECYVLPILPQAQTTDINVKRCVIALSYLLMCQDNVFVTRSGAKEKQSPMQSQTPQAEKVSSEQVAECGRLLEVLKKRDGANENPKIVDVAKIYFKTNYFYC